MQANTWASDRLRERRRRRTAVVVVSSVAAMLLAVGCGGSTGSGASSANAGAPTAGGSNPSLSSVSSSLLANLNAPSTAVKLPLNPGPVVTTPLTHEQVRLMWGKDYPVPAGPIGDPHKTYTVCFSQGLVNNPWSTAQRESVMIEAARHSNLKVTYYNTNDPSQQVQDLQNCQNQHANAILVWPQTTTLTPEITNLCKAGAVVIGMERTVPTHCFTSWVYLDYPGAVTQVAKATAAGIGGSGEVVESEGSPGSSPEILRHYYFVKTLDQYPKIHVVETTPTDFGPTTGYNSAITFLHSPEAKNIKAWYAQYEEEAIGIEKALKQVNRTNIPIYTIGGTRQSICYVESGNFKYLEPGSATPLHGDMALRLAILKIEGKAIPKYVLLGSPPAITSANAKQQYTVEGWGPSASCGG